MIQFDFEDSFAKGTFCSNCEARSWTREGEASSAEKAFLSQIVRR
jgi:hypothetical protein